MNELAVSSPNVLALCAGSGALELGLGVACDGARGVCYVEREAYAAALLVARMEAGKLAQAPIWGDIGSFDGRPWRGVVDIVTSGDPCQPNSVAGRGKGSDDDRWLLDQVLRIVDEVRPHNFFRENVPGNASGQLAVAVPALEGMGYRVAAGFFRAMEVGASHQRERLFILAELAEPGCRTSWRGEPQSIARGDCASEPHQEGRALEDAQRPERRESEPAGYEPHRHDAGRPEETGGAGGRSAGLAHASDRPGRLPLRPGEPEQADPDAGGPGEAMAVSDEGRGGARFRHLPAGKPDPEGRGPDMANGACVRGQEVERGEPDGVGGSMADARCKGLPFRLTQKTRGEHLGPEGATPRGGSMPLFAPGPGSPDWPAILDADPLLEPAIGNVQLWNIARRALGLPPMVGAVGRRGGMARDMDEATTALAQSMVRRISARMAPRVDRLRAAGNGVCPLQAAYAYCALDAVLAAAPATR